MHIPNSFSRTLQNRLWALTQGYLPTQTTTDWLPVLQASTAQLLVFILGVQYLYLGVLMRVFRVRYAVYNSLQQQDATNTEPVGSRGRV